MNEQLLQFIWQHKFFNFLHLQSETGENIEVVHVGHLNTHQGPDFLEAKIKVNNTLWVGSVEVHVKSSQWNAHKHSIDKKYNNVILHVVWENDAECEKQFPTLCLQPFVSSTLLEKYQFLLQKKSFVPCEEFLPQLNKISWWQWQERMGIQRLERKSNEIIDIFKNNKGHWEETFWQLLAKNMGQKVNADIFYEMAKRIPLNVLAKHKNQIHQLEAMLFGITNLIPKYDDDKYVQLLQREFIFLQKKYGLQKLSVSPLFLRMRPVNFPSIRLAQLAKLIHTSSHLFSTIKEAQSLEEIKDLFMQTTSDYWLYHYRIDDKEGNYAEKKIGIDKFENIVINTVSPILFAYGIYTQNQDIKNKSVEWLQLVHKEKNIILSHWKNYGVNFKNALHSQGLIELKNEYCDKKNCLNCHVGKSILSNSK